ncbi:MAG: imidazolonepropionase-like amidohydrolase [Verrucomicrobiales bacterium]|jgi:imidazolonepropionase-like amidohydrolase
MKSIALTILATALFVSSSEAQLAIHGETVHTMEGPAITNGVVLIIDDKITQVGAADDVEIPEGYQERRVAVVTPGIIDAHATVGLSGILNYDHDQEQLEKSEPIQPELRAIDAYNPRDPLVTWVRDFGVTTVNTGHAPGAVISGQAMIIKTDRQNVSDGAIEPFSMVMATLGSDSLASGQSVPGTRAKAVAILRTELIKAQGYLKKLDSKDPDKAPDRDLRLEALVSVLRKEKPLLINAHRHQDIQAALRLAEEFKFRLILDGASEAYLLLGPIKEAGIPVIIHPTMVRAQGDQENATFENAKRLHEHGIKIALQSGFERYVPKTRVVLFEAGMAAAYGLPQDVALASITKNAAEILGIDDRVGSLAPGKDADLALYDGDPFEYTTHCVGVIIDGNVLPVSKR